MGMPRRDERKEIVMMQKMRSYVTAASLMRQILAVVEYNCESSAARVEDIHSLEKADAYSEATCGNFWLGGDRQTPWCRCILTPLSAFGFRIMSMYEIS